MRGGLKSEPALMKTPASWKMYAKSCSTVGCEEFMQGMEQRPNDVVVRMYEISTIVSLRPWYFP